MRRLLLIAALLIFGSINPAAQAATLPGPLVESDWLKANLANVVILDVRADLRSFTAKPVFRTDKKSGTRKLLRVGGHIKGAHLLSYGKIRGTQEINGVKVTRMALPRAEFEGLLQNAGINKDDAVVIVTKGASTGDMTIATRVFWQMKYFGHDNLAILNGGMAQWLMDGNEVSTAAPASAKGNWVASGERKHVLATSDQVKSASEKGDITLIDARP